MSLRRHAIPVAMRAPTTIPMPRMRPMRGRRLAGGSGSVILGTVKDEPDDQRHEHPEARIDEGQRTQVRLEAGPSAWLATHRGAHSARHHADEPSREEGALDVEDGIAAGGRNGGGAERRERKPPIVYRDC